MVVLKDTVICGYIERPADMVEIFNAWGPAAAFQIKEAQEVIFRMYRPLLVKNAMEQNVFDEDLYQEFSATLLNCIWKFAV